jgi:predicted membrane GTPase involved in stress response
MTSLARVTPQSIRMRERFLIENERKREAALTA